MFLLEGENPNYVRCELLLRLNILYVKRQQRKIMKVNLRVAEKLAKIRI